MPFVNKNCVSLLLVCERELKTQNSVLLLSLICTLAGLNDFECMYFMSYKFDADIFKTLTVIIHFKQ